MSGSAPAIAVTGASGFIGRHLCARFARAGWPTRALVRRPELYEPPAPGIRAFACDLPDRIDPEALRGAGVVIHCAYVTRHTSLEEAARVNDLGTRRLLETSRAAGVERFGARALQSCSQRVGASGSGG